VSQPEREPFDGRWKTAIQDVSYRAPSRFNWMLEEIMIGRQKDVRAIEAEASTVPFVRWPVCMLIAEEWIG